MHNDSKHAIRNSWEIFPKTSLSPWNIIDRAITLFSFSLLLNCNQLNVAHTSWNGRMLTIIMSSLVIFVCYCMKSDEKVALEKISVDRYAARQTWRNVMETKSLTVEE